MLINKSLHGYSKRFNALEFPSFLSLFVMEKIPEIFHQSKNFNEYFAATKIRLHTKQSKIEFLIDVNPARKYLPNRLKL